MNTIGLIVLFAHTRESGRNPGIRCWTHGQNLQEMMQKKGDLVSVSVTLEQASYEIMAKVREYRTSGHLYDKMIEALTRLGIKEGLDKYGIKVLGIWVLEPVEVWNQGPGPKAGPKIV